MATPTIYRKHFIPLESNPEVFTNLIHRLGVSKALAFHDVYSLEPDLLAFMPRPTHGLVLVLPTSALYEEQKAKHESARSNYQGKGESEPVVWYKQTINNACGLYGILHVVSNGPAKDSIVRDSALARILAKCVPLEPNERAQALENDDELEAIYKLAATQGDSAVPANPEDEVDYHYICFVRSAKDGYLYILDGDCKGPERSIPLRKDQDLLSDPATNVVKGYIDREQGGNLGFSLLALSPA